MNLFFIDRCPIKSAQQLCDKHVVKMVLETAQMCSTAMHEWGFARHLKHVYKTAYKNHPMTVWVRDNRDNFAWAVNHGLEIGKEYTRRYGKLHKSTKVLEEMDFWWVHDNYSNHTTPPQCMPDEFKCDDYVEAYRAYYRKDKAHILQWTGRPVPEWIAT
jgi:hypothetical protein